MPSYTSKVMRWNCTLEFFWNIPQAGRGPKNPKRLFLYYWYIKLSYSYHSKRWVLPSPYITNSTKLQNAHMKIHLQTYRLIQLCPWFWKIKVLKTNPSRLTKCTVGNFSKKHRLPICIRKIPRYMFNNFCKIIEPTSFNEK